MKNKQLAFLSTFLIVPCANAVVVSRVDVVGNQRMDAESIRILGEVKAGDNVNSEKINNIAKKAADFPLPLIPL